MVITTGVLETARWSVSGNVIIGGVCWGAPLALAAVICSFHPVSAQPTRGGANPHMTPTASVPLQALRRATEYLRN